MVLTDEEKRIRKNQYMAQYRITAKSRIAALKVACRANKPEQYKERGKAYRERTRPKRLAKKKEYRENNAEKVRAGLRSWAVANREKIKAQGFERKLVGRYGMSVVQYNEMLEAQGGTCAICPTKPTEKQRLAIDHCHETGKVRSLLCHMCNKHLGIFEKNYDRFLAYTKKHGGLVGR